MLEIPQLSASELWFPAADTALKEPNGLLAVGGDLSTSRLLLAYQRGIFPWYSPGEPIMWWTPNPRCVLFPQQLRLSKSLRKTLKKHSFKVTADTAFRSVVQWCQQLRPGHTWIDDAMLESYVALHKKNHAHSIEVWRDTELVGGLYGVACGEVFFGESMFSRETDTSKIAFAYLVTQLQRWHFQLVDCQVHSDHLVSLGAETITRSVFCELLEKHAHYPDNVNSWSLSYDLDPINELAVHDSVKKR